MVHRIELSQASTREFSFFGRLDPQALASLRELSRRVGGARVVLRAGTEIVPECMQGLLELDLLVTAESPYLAHWLKNDRRGEAVPRPAGDRQSPHAPGGAE